MACWRPEESQNSSVAFLAVSKPGQVLPAGVGSEE